MIAGWKLAARMQKLEESPDFMSIVPGNTWGESPRKVTENKPPEHENVLYEKVR